MRTLTGLLFVISLLHVRGHDIKVAYFEISEGSGSYELLVRFDRGDILKELGTYGDLNQAISTYLKGHLSLLFDGKRVLWQVNSVDISDLFITVKCNIQSDQNNITTINVWNTSLIDSVDGHDNVIVSTLHNRRRSFRLNKKRPQTTIKY